MLKDFLLRQAFASIHALFICQFLPAVYCFLPLVQSYTFAPTFEPKSNIMAFSTTTSTPVSTPAPQTSPANDGMATILSAILLTAYAGAKSRKQLRKLKRQAAWLVIKHKAKSMFSRKAASERQTIIYILLGVAVLALIFASPIAALVLAIIGLILILTGTI